MRAAIECRPEELLMNVLHTTIDPSTTPPGDTMCGGALALCMLEPREVTACWFAVMTRPRHERTAYDQLVQKGVQAFLPTIGVWSRWKDRRKKVNWPLFPGYCFARFDSRSVLPVLKCSGVRYILSINGEPVAIPDLEIEGIQRLVTSELQFDPCPLIREGTAVEVVHGPLTGAVGRLAHKGTDAMLILSVELLGRSVSVKVDACDVRAL
jgi:transcriptional antiterminator NusG